QSNNSTARVGRLLRVRHNGTTWRAQALACGLNRHPGGVMIAAKSMTEGTESAHSVARDRRREHGPKSTMHWLGAPQPTVEAVMYELRTDGIAALKERDQLKEVIARLIKLRGRSYCPGITDELFLALDEIRK